MLSENGQNIETTVLMSTSSDMRPKEHLIQQLATNLRFAFPVTDAEYESVIHSIHAKLTIIMDQGTAIEREHRPWLSERKAQITPFYWDRYRRLLLGKQKWPPLVVNTLDRVSDAILDLVGDPNRDDISARKGLIVGDVQSGKTATYTALACKAADADYRLIILLTGTIETLRRQTHERLDEGFVGRDSYEYLHKKPSISKNTKIGVGLIDGRHYATVFTSRSRDFSIQLARTLGFSVKTSAEPILLVCKKNPRILENLRTWLEFHNTDGGGSIDTPLLLIDDEADSASINTNALEEKATRTNREIRSLLKLFKRSTYVGVTATPFANVFIHPTSVDDMLGDDLFPRDFIYSLEPPTDYLGPAAIFSHETIEPLRYFDDAEQDIPLKHKIDHAVEALPESLLAALRSFVLASTIRDLRGEGPSHRSMLVNVSRFTRVHLRVASLIDAELRELQRDIRLYSGLEPDDAMMRSARLAALNRHWLRDFDTNEFNWHDVQRMINRAIQPVVVKTVNQQSGAASLDYKAHKENGLRVIAVGGNSLSRGITLEGLSTSYFYRNSKMYDTLLQMGRWFGYRPGYADLCRLWLTEDAFSWFSHITEATAELKAELKRMNSYGMSPRDFGLKVRAHPDSLIVTARNKMRTAQDFVHYISLSRQGLETVRLRADLETNQHNYDATVRLIEAIASNQFPRQSSRRGWHSWTGVPHSLIASFIADFRSDLLNFNFQTGAVASFIGTTAIPALQTWDVAIANPERGECAAEAFASLLIHPIRRKLVASDEGTLLVSGTKARVGPGGAEQEGLTKNQVDAIRQRYPDRTVPDWEYREVRERPLLLLYLVRGYTLNRQRPESEEVPFRPGSAPLIALGLSFPRFDDTDTSAKAAYKVNVVEWNRRFGSEFENDDDNADFDDDDD